MSDINISQTDLNITVTPNTYALNVYTGGYACAQGNTTEFQYNNGGVLSGANGLTYTSGSQTTTAANLTVTNNTDLGAIGNITITGGNAGEFLQTDGSGGLTFTEIANANFAAYAGNIIEPAQPNITSVGNLSNLTVTGNVTATYFLGNGSQLTGLAATDSISNGTSNVKVLSTNGNVAIGVNGNANVLVATATGIVVPGANLGSVSNLIITGGNNGFYLQTDGTGNLSWVSGGGSGNGTVGGSNLQIQYNDGGVFGGTAGFTFDKATNAMSAPGNITAVGNIQGNYILGNGALLTGISSTSNSLVNGTSNVIIDANANIRMSLAGYANTLVIAPGNINITNANVILSNGIYSGNGSGLNNIQGANVAGSVGSAATATVAGTVTTAAQPNITSVGTLTGLNVDGNLAVNIGRISGNGSGLFALPAANITGTVANATYATSAGSATTAATATTAGTVTTAAQPNITSVGTLTGLTVSSTITGSVSGTAARAGTVTTNAQPNITSVGTLTSLDVSGNINVTGNLIANTANTNAYFRDIYTRNVYANGYLVHAATFQGSGGNFFDVNITGTLTANNFSTSGISNGTSGISIVQDGYITLKAANSNVINVNATLTSIGGDTLNISGNTNINSNLRVNATANLSTANITTLNVSGNSNFSNLIVSSGSVYTLRLTLPFSNTNAAAGTTVVHANNVSYQRYNVTANGAANTVTVNYANLTTGSNIFGSTYKTLIYNNTGNSLTIVPQVLDINSGNQIIANGRYALLQVDVFGNIDSTGVSTGTWLFANV